MVEFSTSLNSYNFVSNTSSKKESSDISNSKSSNSSNEVLGYKIDKDGYFAEEFNEAAGIPKDYKIHSTSVEKYLKTQTVLFSGYSSIDIAQTFKNGFKVFSQLLNDELASKQSFTKEDLANLPQAYDLDKKSLNVIKSYTLNEQEYKDYVNGVLTNHSPSENIIKTTTFDLALGKNFDEEFQFALDKIQGDKYINADGSIDKSGVFMAFLTGWSLNYTIREGETTIWGKIQGLDKDTDTSILKELEEFMEQNPAEAALLEKIDLLNSNLSIDEFKAQWLKLKEISDKRKAQWKEESELKTMAFAQNTSQTNTEQTEQSSAQKRSPIQATSKNEIYKDTTYSKFKDLLKNQQDLDTLSILFESIKSGKNKNFMSLLNWVDIKV